MIERFASVLRSAVLTAEIISKLVSFVFTRELLRRQTSRQEIVRLENTLSKQYLHQPVIGVSSGTDALILALKAVGVGSDDEVIVPAYGCASLVQSLRWLGATPVFVDISPDDLTLNPVLLDAARTQKTKAVFFPHHFGVVSERVKEAKAWCVGHQVILIEDITHVFSAMVSAAGQVPVGTVGDIGVCSFTSGKPLSTYGNAGMVTTANELYLQKIKWMSSYGASIPHQEYPVIGANLRLDDIHAAILRIKLRAYASTRKHRQVNYREYLKHLSKRDNLLVPTVTPDRFFGNQLVIQMTNRDTFLNQPDVRGVTTIKSMYPVPLPDLFAATENRVGRFPVANKISATTLSLPLDAVVKNDIDTISRLLTSS